MLKSALRSSAKIIASSWREDPLRLVAMSVASAWLLGTAVLSPASARGDGGEYHLMAESLAGHLTPALRAADVASLASRARREGLDLNLPAALLGYFEAGNGAWYCYHFWGYSLATLPVRLVLAPLHLQLRAPQVLNAVLLLLALHQALYATNWPRAAAMGLFGLAVFSPAAWFVLWTHPESYCFALTLLALVWSSGHRHTGAITLAAIAATQNPPLAFLVVVLAARAYWLQRKARAWLDVTAAAHVTLAALPMAVAPLFYMATFGTPSVLARESTDWRFFSLSRFVELVMDLNIGLLPYLPLAVPLFFLALILKPKLSRSTLGFVLAIAALACTFTGNWNHGTSGPSRYGVWLAALLIFVVSDAHASALEHGSLRAARAWTLVVASAVCAQAIVVFARGGLRQPMDALQHSWAASLVLRWAPDRYNPSPEIFVSRTRGAFSTGARPAVYLDAHGCRKAWVRPKDANWLRSRCGLLPESQTAFFEQTTHRREWRYISWP